MNADSVLLVAFKYPPYDEVGSRRWARLSRHFAELGVQVHVLTVRWGSNDTDSVRAVTHPNLHIHRLPSLGFHRLRGRRRLPKRLQGKLVRMMVKREMLEDARLWGLVMVPYAKRLIRKHGIKHVVATGAPFWSNWWILKLKKFQPNVALIQDFRDPWTDNPVRVKSYSPERISRWQRMESEVLAKSDLVVTVTQPLMETLAEKSAAPVEVVVNGYEMGEFPPLEPTGPRPFRLMYAGTLGSGRYESASAFLEVVREVAREMPELRLSFWGSMPAKMSTDFADLVSRDILELCGVAKPAELMREMRDESFGCLHFETRPMSSYALSSKIFEYAFARRPVLSVNYGGPINEFIRGHRLGHTVHGDDRGSIREALRTLYQDWCDNPSMETDPEGIDEYEYGCLAQRYLGLLQGISSLR